MARVVLLSATPPGDPSGEHLAPLLDLRICAERDRFRTHTLTDDPAAAEVILFVESYGAGWHFERVRRHPLVRRYREKCFLFSTNPLVIPFLPGIYTGIEKRWASRRTVSGFYVGLTRNDFMSYTPPAADLPYLFSFMGSVATAELRRKLLRLEHPRAFLQDTSPDFDRALHQRMSAREQRDYRRRYAEMVKASKFVLCPRGVSPSSIRLFETMRMGRVPVILSDAWVEPPGPQWEQFAIRIAERDYASVPALLEARESEAVRMGERARAEWLEWFSDEVAFHRVVEWCLLIAARRRLPEQLARWPVYLQYLRPFHLRRALGGKFRALRQAITAASADKPAYS